MKRTRADGTVTLEEHSSLTEAQRQAIAERLGALRKKAKRRARRARHRRGLSKISRVT